MAKRSSAQLDREIAESLANQPEGRDSIAHPAQLKEKAPRTRPRKTRDVFVVQGNYGYGHGWEDLTAEEHRKEGLARLREYRENEAGTPFRLVSRREKIAP